LVQDRWRQHLAGVNNWEHFIWNILMFQSWYKNFHEKA
jgi:asparagine synthase (glutamine-hydrolysing)